MKRFCPLCGQVTKHFFDEEQAQFNACSLNGSKGPKNKDKASHSVIYCDECNAWHIVSNNSKLLEFSKRGKLLERFNRTSNDNQGYQKGAIRTDNSISYIRMKIKKLDSLISRGQISFLEVKRQLKQLIDSIAKLAKHDGMKEDKFVHEATNRVFDIAYEMNIIY